MPRFQRGLPRLAAHVATPALVGPSRRFSVVVAVGLSLLVAFNVVTTGGALVSGQLGWQSIDRPTQLLRTFIDPRHGLLLFAPWVVCALFGLWNERRSARPLALFTPGLLGLGLLLMVFGSMGELCFGPRLWLPVLPLLAVYAVRWAQTWQQTTAVAVGGVLGAVAILPGLLAWPLAWEQPAWALWQMLR